MIKASFVIASFNTKKLTLDCIASIKKYVKLDYEIVIVDNGSNDGSLQAIKGLNDPKIKIIENRKNLGFAKANNQGIKKAKGEYILLLNSDTQIRPEAVEKLVNFASITPDAGVVGPRLLNPDGSLQPSCYHFPSIGNAIKEFWFGQKGAYEKYSPREAGPVEVDSLVMAAFLITPQSLKKVGLLNEKYFMFFEDLDYCRRVHNAKLKVYYFPNAEVIHYQGASGKNLASKDVQWKRLIPSSKIYHGLFRYYLLTAILWLGQKWERFHHSQQD